MVNHHWLPFDILISQENQPEPSSPSRQEGRLQPMAPALQSGRAQGATKGHKGQVLGDLNGD